MCCKKKLFRCGYENTEAAMITQVEKGYYGVGLFTFRADVDYIGTPEELVEALKTVIHRRTWDI